MLSMPLARSSGSCARRIESTVSRSIDSILRLQAHLCQAVAQGVAREAEQPGGLALVSVGAAERLADQLLLVLVERQPVREEVRLARLRARAGGRFELDVGRVELRS